MSSRSKREVKKLNAAFNFIATDLSYNKAVGKLTELSQNQCVLEHIMASIVL